jgi:hypothetical protein
MSWKLYCWSVDFHRPGKPSSRPYAMRLLPPWSTPKLRAPFCLKTHGGKHSFRTRRVKSTPYRVRVIVSRRDNTKTRLADLRDIDTEW